MTKAEIDQRNVFQMFVEHGGPGFWVRRTTWSSTCARVIRVGAIKRAPPYYGNPSVLMDVYTLDGVLKEAAAQLSVPGTYKTWRQIDPPEWASLENLRPLDDPAIDDAVSKLNRRRNKHDAKPEPARINLTVPFERKEEAKEIGAKWDPSVRSWWIKEDDRNAVEAASGLGFLS